MRFTLAIISGIIQSRMILAVYFSLITDGERDHRFAASQCENIHARLPGLESTTQLIPHLLKTNIKSVWLSSKANTFHSYKWLDGSDIDQQLASVGKSLGYACGTVDLNRGAYDFLPCDTDNLSFLCQRINCTNCRDIGRTNRHCFEKANSCYIFHCGVNNWHAAKKWCHDHGESLAILKDKGILNQITNIGQTGNLDPCSNCWIGSRLTDWNVTDNSIPWLWADSEPKDGKTCSVLSMEKGEYRWKAASCMEEHHIFCETEPFEPITASSLRAEDSITSGVLKMMSSVAVYRVLFVAAVYVWMVNCRSGE